MQNETCDVVQKADTQANFFRLIFGEENLAADSANDDDSLHGNLLGDDRLLGNHDLTPSRGPVLDPKSVATQRPVCTPTHRPLALRWH